MHTHTHTHIYIYIHTHTHKCANTYTSLGAELLSHYRPIANLPFLSKILEKTVANRLSTYMTENGLHETLQSAYKPGHSTESALTRIQNDILLDLDDKKALILVLLDLSAAFDTIDHSILMQRLQNRLGITGNALAWFSSYLSDRNSSISIDGKLSSPSSCRFGVPQGSVLGPILFTIYTMPISAIISSFDLKYHFYADDTQLYLSFNPKKSESFDHALSRMEMCIRAIKTWMSHNMLQLNDKKTEVLFIASPHFQKSLPSQTLMVDTTNVSRSQSASNIGVIFDHEMSMKNHIASTSKMCHFHLRNIGSIRKYLTEDACKTLIHSLISSRLDYCNSLLVNLPSSTLEPLQRVLNTAARIVSLRPKREHITPVLRALHWLPVRQRITFKILLITFRCIYGLAPKYLSELLKVHEHKRHLRSSGTTQLDYNIPNTKYGERAFSTSGPILWNSLPVNVRQTESLGVFKTGIKTFLFNEAFP